MDDGFGHVEVSLERLLTGYARREKASIRPPSNGKVKSFSASCNLAGPSQGRDPNESGRFQVLSRRLRRVAAQANGPGTLCFHGLTGLSSSEISLDTRANNASTALGSLCVRYDSASSVRE